MLPTAMAMYVIGLAGVMLYYFLFPIFLVAGPSVSALIRSWGGAKRGLYFLDRFCIVQSPEDQKLKGIYSLDQYLKTSEKLIVAYDDDYFARTWCMFEVATYSYLLQEPISWNSIPYDQFQKGWAKGISLVPVPAVPYFISVFVWSFCASAAMAAVGTDNRIVHMLNAYAQLEPQYLGLLAFAAVAFISMLGVFVGTLLCFQKLKKIDLSTWTWDDAQCTVPADKDKVKDMINALYKEEAWYESEHGNERYENGMDFFISVVVRARLNKKVNQMAFLMAVAIMIAAASPLAMVIIAIAVPLMVASDST
mmetsp:Transcript_47115/g.84855  ORF Transcript_47115/g.84855 Transcript_47115/m.84855 type:complete len:308 (+) Transcript_47115:383-1306(+)